MTEESATASKLAYHAPVLEEYGTMAELTAGGGPTQNGQDGPPTYSAGLS